MARYRIFILILLYLTSANAQFATGGSGGGWSNEDHGFFVNLSHNQIRLGKIRDELVNAFRDSWLNCGKGEPPFDDLRTLYTTLTVSKIGNVNKPIDCKKDCLFQGARVKAAIHDFNNAKLMKAYLNLLAGYTSDETKAIMSTFKSYEQH